MHSLKKKKRFGRCFVLPLQALLEFLEVLCHYIVISMLINIVYNHLKNKYKYL